VVRAAHTRAGFVVAGVGDGAPHPEKVAAPAIAR
jgi:hypothetical protein